MGTVLQRPLRGSRISSFYPVKNLPSLSSLDSAFQLQEYISLLIRLDVHDVDAIVSVPGRKDRPQETVGEEDTSSKSGEKDSEKERKNEVGVDEACWIYEQLRRLAQDLSHPLITMLQQECTRASCPEMKAGEWQYLCVAHGNEGAREQCCAIDYILHTLDSATALLNSPRAFPSRLSIPQTSHRHFSALARRLGRIFAHAYFHHREAFEQAEAESSLYSRFLALTSKFDLVPAEFLVIPPRLSYSSDSSAEVPPPRLLAAAIDPGRERSRGLLDVGRDWTLVDRGKRKSPDELTGTESPRKMGRNRTDTMVFSEAFNMAEELAKVGDEEVAEDEAGPSGESPMDRVSSPELVSDIGLEHLPSEEPLNVHELYPVETSTFPDHGDEPEEAPPISPVEADSTSTEVEIIHLEPADILLQETEDKSSSDASAPEPDDLTSAAAAPEDKLTPVETNVAEEAKTQAAKPSTEKPEPDISSESITQEAASPEPVSSTAVAEQTPLPPDSYSATPAEPVQVIAPTAEEAKPTESEQVATIVADEPTPEAHELEPAPDAKKEDSPTENSEDTSKDKSITTKILSVDHSATEPASSNEAEE